MPPHLADSNQVEVMYNAMIRLTLLSFSNVSFEDASGCLVR